MGLFRIQWIHLLTSCDNCIAVKKCIFQEFPAGYVYYHKTIITLETLFLSTMTLFFKANQQG